jgi:phosphoribosyl 1,2-cyclic phosphodiesterase
VRVTFCGTRGSTPAPGPEFVHHGGHTSCVALSPGRDRAAAPALLLDAGTGLRRVDDLLDGGPFRGTILLSHLHWDHVQGLPFFRSGDREDAEVRVLLPGESDDTDAAELLTRMMSPPFFPITPRQLRGRWTFGLVPRDPFEAEGFSVEARDVPHKGGRTVGFRIADGRGSLAYLPDHCPTNVGPGPDGLGEYHEAALALARDVDLLVHDSHLRADELAAQASYGHAAAEYAVQLATTANAGRVALFHHAPDRTDAEVERTLCHLARRPAHAIAASEGTTLEL